MATVTEDYPVTVTASTVEDTDPWKILMAAMLCTTSLLAFLGNLLVMVAFVVTKRLRTNFNIFLLNLAVTDILVSVTGIPFFITDFMFGYWPMDEVVCGVWIFMDWGMTFASIFTLVAISVDRYWAACWSTHYRTHNSRRRVALFLAAVWLAVFILWIPPFVIDRTLYSEPGSCIWAVANNRAFVVVVAICGYHGPSFLMIFCYIRVFLVMRKSRAIMGPKRVQPVAQSDISATVTTGCDVTLKSDGSRDATEGTGSAAPPTAIPSVSAGVSTAPTQQTNVSSKEMKIFISMSYIVVAYLVTWSPFHVVFDILYFDETAVSVEWYNFAVWMCYMNSAINPVIYAYANSDFRQAFIKILSCGMLK